MGRRKGRGGEGRKGIGKGGVEAEAGAERWCRSGGGRAPLFPLSSATNRSCAVGEALKTRSHPRASVGACAMAYRSWRIRDARNIIQWSIGCIQNTISPLIRGAVSPRTAVSQRVTRHSDARPSRSRSPPERTNRQRFEESRRLVMRRTRDRLS